MSEELSVGVKILLERSKTNPDELKEEYGQWGQLREAVFAYKERKDRGPWLRGLTEQEIDALYEMFNSLYRGVFDAWVMKTVLGGDEEKPELDVYAISKGKQLLQSNSQSVRVSPAHNNINTLLQPGGIYETQAIQTSNTPMAVTVKSALGIK